jgi:hypothetical protein
LLSLGRFAPETVVRVNEAVDSLAKRGYRSLGVISQQVIASIALNTRC